MSYTVNSPQDDESSYMSERITRDTLLVQERTISQKEFPSMTAAKVQDKESVNQACYSSIKG